MVWLDMNIHKIYGKCYSVPYFVAQKVALCSSVLLNIAG